MSPSAHPAAHSAVSALIAPATSPGGSSGKDQTRARSTVDEPAVRHLLAAPQRAHHVDALAQPCHPHVFVGQGSPVTCSLSASPLPSATHGNRPGNMAATVAIACAEITG